MNFAVLILIPILSFFLFTRFKNFYIGRIFEKKVNAISDNYYEFQSYLKSPLKKNYDLADNAEHIISDIDNFYEFYDSHYYLFEDSSLFKDSFEKITKIRYELSMWILENNEHT